MFRRVITMGDILECALFLSLPASPHYTCHKHKQAFPARLYEFRARGRDKDGLVPTGTDRIKGKSDYLKMDFPIIT